MTGGCQAGVGARQKIGGCYINDYYINENARPNELDRAFGLSFASAYAVNV